MNIERAELDWTQFARVFPRLPRTLRGELRKATLEKHGHTKWVIRLPWCRKRLEIENQNGFWVSPQGRMMSTAWGAMVDAIAPYMPGTPRQVAQSSAARKGEGDERENA